MILVACCIVWQVVWVPVRVPPPRMNTPPIKTAPPKHEIRTWYA